QEISIVLCRVFYYMTDFMNNKNKVIKMSREWHTLERPPSPTTKTAWIQSGCALHTQPISISHDGRTFWQTTAVFLEILCVVALYICSSVAVYWLETLYQSWYGIINFLPHCFTLNRISIQIWLKAAYCEYNCRHYFLPFVVTMCVAFGVFAYIVLFLYMILFLVGIVIIGTDLSV